MAGAARWDEKVSKEKARTRDRELKSDGVWGVAWGTQASGSPEGRWVRAGGDRRVRVDERQAGCPVRARPCCPLIPSYFPCLERGRFGRAALQASPGSNALLDRKGLHFSCRLLVFRVLSKAFPCRIPQNFAVCERT